MAWAPASRRAYALQPGDLRRTLPPARRRVKLIRRSVRLIRFFDLSSARRGQIDCIRLSCDRKDFPMKTKLAALLLIGGASLLPAQDRFDFKVRNYFFAGFAGDAASLEKGMKICEDSIAVDPKNAQALVWHGAGLFYASGQAFQ